MAPKTSTIVRRERAVKLPTHLPPLAVVAVGLVLVGIWTNVVGYSATLLPTETAVATDVTSITYEYGRAFMAIGFVAFGRVIDRNQAWLMAFVATVLAGVACGMFLSYHQDVYDPTAFASVCSFLGGMGYIMLATPFYLLMARHVPARPAALFIALSLAGETVISPAISVGFTAQAQVAISMAAPAGAVACYLAARALFAAGKVPSTSEAKDIADISLPTANPMFPSAAVPTKGERSLLVARLVLICVAAAFIRTLSNVGMWGRERTNFLGIDSLSSGEIVGICATVIVISLAVFVLPRRLSNQTRSFIGLLVVLTGLQLLALGSTSSFAISFDTITTSCELFSHLLTWMTFMECACRLPLPPFTTRGIMVLVNTACTIALGALPLSGSTTRTVIMICMYAFALAFALLVIVATRRETSRNPEDSLDDPKAPEEERTGDEELSASSASNMDPAFLGDLHAFATHHALSAREEEVLALLLHDKTRGDIEEICQLSEGTVRTHVNNTYKKLGIHSKADAQQMFASFRAHGGALRATDCSRNGS